jgi:hypothetical protein
MLEFIVYENTELISMKYENYYIAIHDGLLLLNHVKQINIDVLLSKKESENSKFGIKLETLKINNSLKLYDYNSEYDLKNKLNLYDVLNKYNKYWDYDTAKNECIEQAIKNLIDKTKVDKKLFNALLPKVNTKENKKQKGKEDAKDLCQNILKKINSNSHSELPDVSESESETNSECEPEIKIEKIMIDKLEKIKNMTDNAIEDMNFEIISEEKNLSKFIENTNDYMKNEKKEEEDLKKKISIYTSEKEHTYKKILDAMMKNGGVNFDKIPSLFISKFPVYLFMDGKDCYGNDTREKLFGRDDEYLLFEILYESLTSEDFNSFENENYSDYLHIISEFINYLPNDYQAITEKQIMDYYNEKDCENNPNLMIFKETETEKQECSDKTTNNYLMNE